MSSFVNRNNNNRKHTVIRKLVQESSKLHHLLQLHSLLIKTSHDHYNFIVAQFITKLSSSFSSSSNDVSHYARSIFDAVPYPDTFLWNTMIRNYLKYSQEITREGLVLFSRMQHVRGDVLVDSFSFSLVLQACARSSQEIYGRAVHTLLLKLGFRSDLFVQTALLKMYAKFGRIDKARRIFDEISNPDIVSCNVLLAEYSRIGEMDSARELFDKMTDRDLVSWNTMIHGYASVGEVGSTKSAEKTFQMLICWQFNEALRLFQEMQLANIVPDKITLIGVLSACGGVGTLSAGRAIHESIRRNGIEIDLKLGTSLMDMYAKCGDIHSSLEVFDSMDEKDVFTWSSMIVGLANHGLGESALEYFNEMISCREIKPNEVTFVGVLTACSHLGLVEKGWEYFSSMGEIYGISPNLDHYCCMVDILGRAGRLQEAKKLIENMPFAPDAIVWRAFLGACKVHKSVELAEEAIVKLIELEPRVDGNYVLLSNIYSQAKAWDKVADMRRAMRTVNVQKGPGNSLIEIDDVVHEFIARDTSHPRFAQVYEMLTNVTESMRRSEYETRIK